MSSTATNGKTYVVEGKYTQGKGSYGWEELERVTPEEGGFTEAHRLCREYTICAPYGQHRVCPLGRSATAAD